MALNDRTNAAIGKMGRLIHDKCFRVSSVASIKPIAIMTSKLYSLSYISQPSAKSTSNEEMSGQPLKSEKHPLALFSPNNDNASRRNKRAKSVGEACVMPSLMILSAELFTPNEERNKAPSSQLASVPEITITASSESETPT